MLRHYGHAGTFSLLFFPQFIKLLGLRAAMLGLAP